MIGMKKEGYGTNVSAPNFSETCRHPGFRTRTCQTSYRIHRGRHNFSTVGVNSFCRATEATRLFTTTVDMNHKFATVNNKSSVVKTWSTLEAITEL